MNPVLTIAIPTYNRPNELRNAVAALVPQLIRHPDVTLEIRDNASTKKTYLNDLIPSQLSERVRIIRNDLNIGGNANILRCFECCKTPWLWVLGDDDIPRPDAIDTILSAIDNSVVFMFFNFPQMDVSACWQGETCSGNGIHELFQTLKNRTTPLSLLSATVYNISRTQRFLTEAYAYATSGIPHLIMAYRSLESDSQTRWLLSKHTIADYTPPRSSAGAPMYILMREAPIALLPFSRSHSSLDDLIISLRSVHARSPEFALYSTITGCDYSHRAFSVNCAFLFNLVRAAYHPGITHPFLEIRWNVALLFAYFPAVFRLLVRLACMAIHRPLPYEGDFSR